jgi:uroporphyrinogen decarboxylase
MDPLTSHERITNILQRKPVDRIGVHEHFWGDTRKKWASEGHMPPDQSYEDHFGLDLQTCWAFNCVADLDKTPEVVEETEETQLIRDGNGALLRRHKLHDATPEHVDFLVQDRAAWEEHIKPHLTPDRRRINFEGYRNAKRAAAERDRFFCWGGVNVFEMMHPVCGHEYMLVGMAVDPDWVRDMVDTYAQLAVDLMEILFAEEGAPDGVFFYEDLGFKQRPFMSLDMYREIVQPGHRTTVGYAKGRGLPVILHSCGYVAPLVPGLLEAGIDCLQVIEVKAGMDLVQLYREYGDRLSFMGGMDVRVLYTNDKRRIEEELQAKIPVVKGNHGYVLHSDHSIPDTVDYESYRYFVERGLSLGQYT